jgi:hypothetical protein
LNVTVSQAQKQGKTTSTVTGSNSATVQCNGTTPLDGYRERCTAALQERLGYRDRGATRFYPLNQVVQAVTLGWVR